MNDCERRTISARVSEIMDAMEATGELLDRLERSLFGETSVERDGYNAESLEDAMVIVMRQVGQNLEQVNNIIGRI